MDKFIRERCVLEEKIKTRSSKLYKSYNEWCQKEEDRTKSNKEFTINMKREYPELIIKKYNSYNAYVGIGLKEDEEKEKEEKKRVTKEYNKEYYEKNREYIRQQQANKYRQRKFFDSELMERCNMSEKQYKVMRRHGLIKYIYNDDMTINWNMTIEGINNVKTEYTENIQTESEDIFKDMPELDDNNINKKIYKCFITWYRQRYDEIWESNLADKDILIERLNQKHEEIDGKYMELLSSDDE